MKFQSNLHNLLNGIYFLSSWTFVYSYNHTTGYSSYKPYPWCSPSDHIRYPKTVQDVINIVNEAIIRGVTVKAFGARHSQTDVICTEGIPIDNHRLQFFHMHEDGITATFGAGVNLREATEFLRKHGRGLRTTPAFGNITLGGALGTGSHGSSIKYNASISSQVISITIVDGIGQVRHIYDSENLKAFRLNLGLLGIVVQVTLYTVPLYKTLAHNYVVSDDILTNGVAIDYARTTDQISLYWFPAFKEVVVANWTIVDVNTPGNAGTNDHVPSTYANFNFIATLIKEIAFSLTSTTCAFANSLGYTILHMVEYFMQLTLLIQTPDFVPIYTEDGFFVQNPAVGYYDLMFAPICYNEHQGLFKQACPWSHGDNGITFLDNEFGFDLDDLPAFIMDVKKIISKTPTAFPLQGILLRFSDKTDIYMSTAYGKQTAYFEFYSWHRKDTFNEPTGSLAGYQTIVQTLTRKYRARSHWGKSGLAYHDSESLDLKLDPFARRKFIDVMNEFDPYEIFINSFGRRIKGTGEKVDIDPRTTRCALLDNCICSKNSDCGSLQICTTLPGFNYRVCKTKNEVPESNIDKGLFPPPFGVLRYLFNDISTLAKAVHANCPNDDSVGNLSDLFQAPSHLLG